MYAVDLSKLHLSRKKHPFVAKNFQQYCVQSILRKRVSGHGDGILLKTPRMRMLQQHQSPHRPPIKVLPPCTKINPHREIYGDYI
jgi:hypothetical protein